MSLMSKNLRLCELGDEELAVYVAIVTKRLGMYARIGMYDTSCVCGDSDEEIRYVCSHRYV